ncbi:hypothetical protein Zmor_006853 [Zophobas morio]|uniref:THAP-type domain-containing protein n=1 Tax=Zophobas morio TaxID=2755281 RepID=A0AA38IVT5_9CUCU|nr:hypothetical protein Zmor_006853 [Zophobas morio]
MQENKTCSVNGCAARVKPIFAFPHPKRGHDRFMAWVKAANKPKFAVLTNVQIYRRGYICFQHFRPEDFVPETQRLRRSAVPTILPSRADTGISLGSLEANQTDVADVEPQTIDLTYLSRKKEWPYFYSIANLSPVKRRSPSSQSLDTELETPRAGGTWSSGIPGRQPNFGAGIIMLQK